MKIVVCGSRATTDRAFVFERMDDLDRRFGPFTTVIHDDDDLALRPCDPSLDSSSSDTSSDATSSTDTSESSSSTTEPAFDCPTIANGDVVFDLGGGLSRTVYFSGVTEASATSTLALYWPGTYEWQAEPPTGALPWGFANFADYVNAIVAIPRPDPAAPARAGNPFPWWIVCGQTSPSQCDRDDDFVLAEVVTASSVKISTCASRLSLNPKLPTLVRSLPCANRA